MTGPEMKFYYKGIGFLWNEETGECRVMSGAEQQPGGEVTFSECIEENNPIIALNMFIARVHGLLGQAVADRLETLGRNRYTGEVYDLEQ